MHLKLILINIILSNQILLNKQSRQKYDAYLFSSALNFNELKTSFNKTIKEIKTETPDNESFNSKIEALNKKHGFNSNLNSDPVNDRYNKMKSTRDNQIIINNDIKNINEFNNKFETKLELIEFKESSELSTFVNGDNYTQIKEPLIKNTPEERIKEYKKMTEELANLDICKK